MQQFSRIYPQLEIDKQFIKITICIYTVGYGGNYGCSSCTHKQLLYNNHKVYNKVSSSC